MNTNTPLWQQELLRAHDAEAVLETLRDYLVLWRPDELAQLPEPLHPASIVAPQDVADYAAALLRHEGDGKRTPVREALTAFFLIAARRLCEIASRAQREAGTKTGRESLVV